MGDALDYFTIWFPQSLNIKDPNLHVLLIVGLCISCTSFSHLETYVVQY